MSRTKRIYNRRPVSGGYNEPIYHPYHQLCFGHCKSCKKANEKQMRKRDRFLRELLESEVKIMDVMSDIEISCETCEYYTESSYENPTCESSECLHMGNIAMDNLRTFPFKNGCKHWEPKWYLTPEGQAFVDCEVKGEVK